MPSIESRVRAGATFMDSTSVGWAEKINVKDLDLGSCEDCVLGQRHGHFDTGLKEMGLTRTQVAELGFLAETAVTRGGWLNLPSEEKKAYFLRQSTEHSLLTSAWLAEIAARLSPDSPEAFVDETEFSPVDTSPEGSPL